MNVFDEYFDILVQVRETVRDVCFLQNESMWAAGNQKCLPSLNNRFVYLSAEEIRLYLRP